MTTTGKELLLASLTDFYNKNENYRIILKNIIDGKHELSLRMIDWLVTHYSKNNNIIYWISKNNIFYDFPTDIDDNDKFKKINLYLNYRAQLKSYTKFNFDSFRRHDRIKYFLDENKGIWIETTIGQLNFFRWAFNNCIIEYAINNQKEIYENMAINSYKKQSKLKNKNSLVPKQDIINTRCYLRFD